MEIISILSPIISADEISVFMKIELLNGRRSLSKNSCIYLSMDKTIFYNTRFSVIHCKSGITVYNP